MNEIFSEIGIVVTVATALALIVYRLKQPPLVGYILAGVILGPIGAKFLGNSEMFEAMRQIGTALLLFLVGLELNWTKAKTQIKTISWLGLVQIAGSFAGGLLIGYLFNFTLITSVFIGLALSFSSTIIVVKLLSESRDMNALHGRLAVGLLILQDILAIFVLAIIGGLTQPSSLGIPQVIGLLIIKMVAIVAVIYILANYIMPPIFARIAKSHELLFLSSLAWCFMVAIGITYFDMPLEVGAFLAGISLASLPYSIEMVSKLRSVRDFFVIILFVSMGTTLMIPTPAYINLIIWLLVLTVVVKPLITGTGLLLRGFKSRTAFMAGITQNQLSEFSLLLIVMGNSYGILSKEIVASVTFAAITSMLISSIVYSQRVALYGFIRGILHRIEHRVKNKVGDIADVSYDDHIVIFGYHRMGYHILKKLRSLKHKVVVVDFNPDIIKKLQQQEVECIYGDVQDEDILEVAGVKKAKMVISTVPHREETLFLIDTIRAVNAEVILIVTSNHIDDALEYYHKGASYVIMPHLLGGEHIADLITQYEDHALKNVLKHRAEEIRLLRTRNNALYYD